MEMTIDLWKSMTGREQTVWLEYNLPASKKSFAGRGLVSGVGVNDSKYIAKSKIEGGMILCPAYISWNNMLIRVYGSAQFKHNPAYNGVSVCNEWLMFSAFRSWWIDNQVDGWQIDKDLIDSSGEYSPRSCIFVPQWLNTFTMDVGSSRGDYPIGVTFDKQSGKLKAVCRNPISNKQECVGFYTCQEEAHSAWRKRKIEIALELKSRMDGIDCRIFNRVVDIIMAAR